MTHFPSTKRTIYPALFFDCENDEKKVVELGALLIMQQAVPRTREFRDALGRGDF